MKYYFISCLHVSHNKMTTVWFRFPDYTLNRQQLKLLENVKYQQRTVVLVSNNSMYIDIKPYFCFCIDRYWNIGSWLFSEKELPNPFTSFRSSRIVNKYGTSGLVVSEIWQKMIGKPIYFLTFIFYLHGKQLNCIYLVVCSDIDIVPYIIDISTAFRHKLAAVISWPPLI